MLLLWARLKIYASHDYVMCEMSVCMCVKQQTDDLYIIIFNCRLYTVSWLIVAGIIAVQRLPAETEIYISTHTSWLDRHVEFVFRYTLDVTQPEVMLT